MTGYHCSTNASAVALLCLTLAAGCTGGRGPIEEPRGEHLTSIEQIDKGGEARPQKAPPIQEAIAELRCITAAYGDFIREVRNEQDVARAVVVMNDGTEIRWEDGIEGKTFEQLLDEPDLQDQMSIRYPPGRRSEAPGINDDPGRIRVESFFKSIYGADKQAVKDNLVTVDWMPRHGGGKLRFNERNGAADALRAVSSQLDEGLPEDLLRYVIPTAGTFNWRKIAGTARLSVHSFGLAVDINVKHSDYWRWTMKRNPSHPYRNKIPFEVVEVFEEHGFIWGGKWYHFDTMHFEYRPELLHPACLRATSSSGRRTRRPGPFDPRGPDLPCAPSRSHRKRDSRATTRGDLPHKKQPPG